MHKILKPKAGLTIRDPYTGEALPEKGRRVKINSFWLRRLRDGDVLEVAEKTAAKETPKAAKSHRDETKKEES